MQARDMMTKNPCCCQEETTLRDVARMMVEHDCGEIPVVGQGNVPVGVITDRDITCRAVSQGADTNSARAGDFMTSPAVTVRQMDSADDCRRTMEEHMIRRVPVVDEAGMCIGIVAQADVAQKGDSYSVSHLVKEISVPNDQ